MVGCRGGGRRGVARRGVVRLEVSCAWLVPISVFEFICRYR